MIKNRENILKKTSLEAQGSKKMIWGILLLVVIFAMNLISALNWTVGLNNNLRVYYNFNTNSGNITDDVVSHIRNGTMANDSSWVSGILGNAISFDGVDDRVNITNASAIFDSTQVSTSFWIYPITNYTTAQYLWDGFPNRNYHKIQTTWDLRMGGITAIFTSPSINGSTIEPYWTLNSWHHIVLIYDSTGNNQFWLDGSNRMNDTTIWTPADSQYMYVGINSIFSNPLNARLDEWGFWNRALTGAEAIQLYNQGSGIPYLSAPPVIVNLSSPNNGVNITNPFTFNTTLIPGSFNLTNATLYIWYSNNTLYTSSTTSLTGNSINTTNWSINFNSFLDSYIWNVRGCMGDGGNDGIDNNCSFAGSNNTFNVKKIVEFNQTFTTPTTGGSTQNFQIRINASNGYTVTIPYLVYNGTSYEATISQSGSNYIISRTITVPFPSANQNLSFYWNITLDDSTFFKSLTKNQTINTISLDNCASFTNQIFSFSMSDEETQVNMSNTTIEYAFNIYNQARTSLLFGINASSNANPTLICLNTPLTNTTFYSLDATLKYHGNDSYVTRYYNFLNFTLTNSTVPRNIILYDVLNATSLPFLLTFRNSQLALGSNILIYVNKQYLASNDFKTVEVPITDSNGQTILNLIRNTAVYNFIMVDIHGNVVASFSNVVAFCQDYTIGSCAIDLNAPGGGQLTYNYDTDVGISYSVTYLNSSKLVSLAFNSLNSSSLTARMLVRTENQFQNKTICDTSQTAITSSISCNLSNAVKSNQYFFVDIYVGGRFVETVYINTNPFFTGVGGGFGMDGFFIAILIVLSIILLFADDKQSLVIAVGVGWAVIVALGLVKGGLIGIASGGIWLLVTIFIFLWKLKKEETP